MLRDVAEPQSIRRIGAELPFHEVLVGCGVRLPPASLPAVRDAHEPVDSHQPGDAFPANVNAEPEPQLGKHTRRPIRLPRVSVDPTDRGRQLRIRDRTPRWWPAEPLVEAGL